MSSHRVGILGGSFNPPHLGHSAMARFALEQKKVEEVWVIPCFEHPFNKPLALFENRFEMCRLAFKNLGGSIQILDLEKRLGGRSYTFRTVEHLKKEFPADHFVLIVGEDVAEEAKSWQSYQELQKGVEWFVIPRGKMSPIPDVSATNIREAVKNQKKLEKCLDKNVVEYISKKGLYRK